MNNEINKLVLFFAKYKEFY